MLDNLKPMGLRTPRLRPIELPELPVDEFVLDYANDSDHLESA